MPLTSTHLPSRRALRLAACVAVPLVIAACAARMPAGQPLPKYVAPAGSPTARLVMRGTMPAGDVYGVYLYDDSEKCAGPRSLGVGNSTRHPASADVAAGRMQTVEVLIKSDKRWCGVRWSFTPVAGKTYLLSANSLAGNANAALGGVGCLARLMDMSDPDHIKPELTALRRNPASVAQCLPLSQSKSVAAMAGNDAGRADGDAVLNPGASTGDLQGLIGR
jgi:hypothetical protein